MELGLLYLADGDRLGVAERAVARSRSTRRGRPWNALGARRIPFCVQDARQAPPPGARERRRDPLVLPARAHGLRAVCCSSHTPMPLPRGFTLLCRRLGPRLAEVASTILGSRHHAEWTAAESARLQSDFAALEL